MSLSQNILFPLKMIGERKEVKDFKKSFMARTEKGIITSAYLHYLIGTHMFSM